MEKIDSIFKSAIDINASDIHLTVNRPPIFRIDGELLPMSSVKPLKQEEAKSLVFGILSEKQQQILLHERELDLSYEIEGG